MESQELIRYLQNVGVIDTSDATVTPLTGGVSSDIRLVSTPTRAFVVKQALAKLRVKADWYADPSRNDFEQAYLRYVAAIVPEAVPSILFSDPAMGLFVMEYLDGFANWKEQLLAGRVDPTIAAEAGRILGTIHRASWGDETAARTFDSTQNFHELRLDPYLLTTAQRHPPLARRLQEEASRMERTRLCLVHGDFSPKNMLVKEERLVLLDCEVAWYGEPAFDAAFLLNHFLLKALHFAAAPSPYLDLVPSFWSRYVRELGDELAMGFEARVARLLPMLMLARVDGKSPAEYITEPVKKEAVRHFAGELITSDVTDLATLSAGWRGQLMKL